ncbi:MAG: sodium-dependent transporter [Candidatus Thiodiazotropha taylori]|nr:sodium-dependent transporter [Candidatus Thiodiazotropha taylori]MCG7916607.1 sodium-dependent transporter [Candidatus Thiodiazotropha taylori]MCG7960925.1 sodium-dependent transporter [Candidatus Thiodiazotropha taylori]MCG8073293.1 sodium-dependent transporter [Candidatus Thiodiazotropha taylori]MCG8088182.1 sodium-dependent transporter [Candidatus Thiodiazotropha taylori]
MAERQSIHGQWSSRLVFILAATGSAVGLGNVWKFPYITGENGGGAFVIIYLVCIALVGVPIMMAEIMLGRRGRQSPINTMAALSREEGANKAWSLIGWSGVLAGFFILSYYSVIAGWALAYVARAGAGLFSGLDAAGVESMFNGLVGSPERLLAWHTLFMLMSMFVVAKGVKSGLEKAVTYLMPALFVLLLLLVGYAMNTGFFLQGLEFLFSPDFSKLIYTCQVVDGVEQCDISGGPLLVAMGHAFFTLSLGMGAIMVYGSYMPKKSSIAGSAVLIALLDTLVALLAGMAIFPIVFANGLEPGAGPGLIFQTLPIAFGAMPGGHLFGTMFFVLLVFAAWSSAISLIEPAVAWLVENREMTRVRASIWIGLTTWVIGLGTVFSFNIWSDVKLFDKTFFDLLDYLTANIMLPLGGLLIAVFSGWFMKKASSQDEFAMNGSAYNLWWTLIRYVSPLAVVVVFLHAIGIF